jgi:putative proteasome-type protease
MTYCCGILVADGLVMIADTRTNAGLDDISTYRKLHLFHGEGRHAIAIATAGNLSATQNVVNLLAEGVEGGEPHGPEAPVVVNRIDEAPTMYAVAQLVGRAVRQVRRVDTDAYEQESVAFQVSFLVGGQVGKERPRLFMVYSAGNFIECSADAPYLQIGEHKYGKPILDRAVTYRSDLYDALKIGLISMDSTLKSNLGVGLPIDIAVVRRDAHAFEVQARIEASDPYFRDLRERWSAALRAAHAGIPRPPYGPEQKANSE